MSMVQISNPGSEIADTLAGLHVAVLSGVLSSLGQETVAKYYQRVINENLGQVTCAFRNGSLVGFILTAEDELRVMKDALLSNTRDRLWLARKSRKRALLNAALSQLHFRSSLSLEEPSLVYIGVCLTERGSGVSQQLLESAEKHLRAHGNLKYWLRVRCDNPAAINFYFKSGFRAQGFEKHSNQLLLVRNLSEN